MHQNGYSEGAVDIIIHKDLLQMSLMNTNDRQTPSDSAVEGLKSFHRFAPSCCMDSVRIIVIQKRMWNLEEESTRNLGTES
jgi:hypothetical protein